MVKINKPSFLIIFLIIFSIINYKDTLADTTPPTGSPSTTPTQNLTIKYNYEISQLSQDDKYYNATLQGWIDSDGNIFHYSDCINDVEKKCPMASYRDNISRIHYVEYCVPVDYDCCGCNTVGQPINVKGEKNTVLTKVGSCFGCPSDSVCTTRNGAGLRYFCDSDCGNSPYIQCKTKSSIVDGVGNVDYFHYKNNLEIDKENQRLLFTIKYDDEEIEQRIISIPLTGLKDNKKDVICHATLYPMGHNKIKGLINYVPKSKSMVIATVKTGITLNSGGNEKDTFYLPKLLTVNNTYSSVGFSGEKFVFSEDENTQYSCVYGGGVYKSEFGNPKSIESKERLFFGNDLYGGCAAIRLGEKTSTILTHPKQKKQILQQEGQNQKLEKQQEHEPQEKEKQELELEQNEIEHLQVQQPKPLPKQQLLYILYVKNKKREIYHNSIHIGNLSNIQPGGETLIKNLPVLYKDEENGISHFEYSEIENLLIYSNSLGIFKVDLSIKRNSKKPIPKLIYKFNVTPSFKYYNGYIYLSTNEKIIRISIKNNKPETLFTFNSDKNNNNKNNKKTSKALYQAGHCICAPGFSNNGTNQCNYCEKSTHIISKDKNTLRCIPLKLDSNPMVCFHSQDCPLSKTCVLNKFSKYGQCLNK